MDAASVKTPETQKLADDTTEKPAEEPASNAKQLTGDVILLVEDNAINMRVSLHRTPLPGCNEAISCTTCWSTIVTGKTYTDLILTSC